MAKSSGNLEKLEREAVQHQARYSRRKAQALLDLLTSDILGPTAIEGRRAKRQSATDEQGEKSAFTRSVRSSGTRRGFARRERANRDAPRPAPSADCFSCEWGASALRCLSGLHVPQWREALQPNKCELLGS